jgi:hypothetical protein
VTILNEKIRKVYGKCVAVVITRKKQRKTYKQEEYILNLLRKIEVGSGDWENRLL